MVISQGNSIFWPFISGNRRIRAAYTYLFYIFPLEILPLVSQAVGEVDHLLLGPMGPETRAILYQWSVYHFTLGSPRPVTFISLVFQAHFR